MKIINLALWINWDIINDLKEKFPKLIYASCSGFGQTGPCLKTCL